MSGRLHKDLSFGQVEQLVRQLTTAGMQEAEVKSILKSKETATMWVTWLKEKLDPASYGQLFQSPGKVFDSFVKANELFVWGFTSEQLRELLTSAKPDFYHSGSRLNSVISLRVWLGDFDETCTQLWEWVQVTHGDGIHKYMLDGLNMGSEGYSDHYGDKPFVEWVEIDLTANRDVAVDSLELSDASYASFELLSCAALHPQWVQSIDNVFVPAVLLENLRWVQPPPLGNGLSPSVPAIRQLNDEIVLTGDYEWRRGYEYAIPTVRDL